jgi:hypothetical protein
VCIKTPVHQELAATFYFFQFSELVLWMLIMATFNNASCTSSVAFYRLALQLHAPLHFGINIFK